MKSEKQKVKINLLLTQKRLLLQNHSKMNKNCYISFALGAIIGILQIISICLQVYFFQDALSSLTKGTKIATLLTHLLYLLCYL